ncbi:D-alanyl-D-alanine carboxypeptidase/D-alanyl-D-alanine-endopeptidase [Labilibacter sediminis]|nr:D-alanyl-D-alanine carboxypeptidase/D-alanyl-D-alanine-endopeptidase [Labilibacter sediminis]
MRYLNLLVLLIFCACSSESQSIISDDGTSVSAKVINTTNRQDIYSFNENQRLIPASLMKVLTTATALELLGKDYTYQTQFGYTGVIKNGVLYGHLVVKSNGDATLGSKYFSETNPEYLFEQLSKVLQSSGIISITGEVQVEGYSQTYPSQRLWEDMGNYYGASPQSFCWKDNTATVTLKSGDVGSLCKIISISPQIKPHIIECRVSAASHTKDSAYVYGIKEISRWWMEGSIPANRSGFKVKAALPDPLHTFATELTSYLNKNGVSVMGNTVNHNFADAEFFNLYTHKSPSLAEIIKVVNHKSNNLFADQLLLTLAKEFIGEVSWDNGNQVINEFWSDKIAFEKHFRVKDGSGLSPKNLFSAQGMVEVLTWMSNHSSSIEVFEQSLAKGGETGTLRSVFKHKAVSGKIIGKSGSMEGVLGYCGYLTSSSKQKAAFCIITNHYLQPTKEIRTSLDNIITQWVLEN